MGLLGIIQTNRAEYNSKGGSNYTEHSEGGDIRFGKILSPYVTVRMTVGYRSVNYSDMDNGFWNPYTKYIGGDATIYTTWGITRNTTDSPRDATKGSKHDFQIELAGLGDNEFWKFDHSSTWYWSLDSNSKWVLSFQMREGVGSPFGSSSVIPLSDRYFAGGASTLGVRIVREAVIGSTALRDKGAGRSWPCDQRA